MSRAGENESDGLDIGVDKVFISGRIGERDMPDHLDLAQKSGRMAVSFSSVVRVQITSLPASLTRTKSIYSW